MAYLSVMILGLFLCAAGHWFVGAALTIATFIMGLLVDFN